MSGQIGTVRNIRVHVEPVEVELDEDDGLQWTALQTAFPGCSGMYFRDRESPCRSAVKFDGKKFRAPGGAWNDREYFVTLSQRCHSGTQMPFGSYENASKQFERSVNAVQKMLASTMGGGRVRFPSTILPPSPPTEKSEKSIATTVSSSPPTSDPIHESLQERETLLRSTNRQLTPLEQQFVDLAKISTGKDAVIEGHRDEIRRLKDRVAELEKSFAEAKTRSSDFEMKTSAQEEELRLMRELGEQQTCMNGKVADLTKTLEKREKELKELQETLTEKEADWKKENTELREKLATLSLQFSQKSQELDEVSEGLQVSQVSRELLAKELDQLRPLAELIDLDEPENVEKYSDTLKKNYDLETRGKVLEDENLEIRKALEDLQNIQNGLAVENTKLTKRNTELEERLGHVDEELMKINDGWKTTMQEKQQEITEHKSESEREIDSLKLLAETLQVLSLHLSLCIRELLLPDKAVLIKLTINSLPNPSIIEANQGICLSIKWRSLEPADPSSRQVIPVVPVRYSTATPLFLRLLSPVQLLLHIPRLSGYSLFVSNFVGQWSLVSMDNGTQRQLATTATRGKRSRIAEPHPSEDIVPLYFPCSHDSK